MILNRRTWLASAGLLSAGWVAPSPAVARTADLPRKLTVMGTFAVGSGPDTVARAIAQHAAQQFGIQMTLVNRPEVHGESALAQFLETPADGHTWLMAEDTVLTINPHMYPRPHAAPLHGLQPLAQSGSNFFLFMVKADDPIQTMADWVREARQAAQPMNFASGGVGSKHHLCMLEWAQRLGVTLNHVAYQGGGQAAAGVARGEVRVALAGASAQSLVKAGKLRVLAITAPQRSARFPGVPCLAETVPHFKCTAWFGWFAKTGTPAPFTEGMTSLVQHAMADAEVHKVLNAKGGLEPTYAPAAALATQLLQEHQQFSQIIKTLPGIQS